MYVPQLSRVPATQTPVLVSFIRLRSSADCCAFVSLPEESSRVCETSATLSAFLCHKGLNGFLNGRDYWWQRSPQCQFAHRGRHSSKGRLFSGCQTRLPLAVTSIACVTVAFSGPLQTGEKPFVIHHITLNPCSLASLFPKSPPKQENGNIPLFISDRDVLFSNSNEAFWNRKADLLSLSTGEF